MTRGVRLPAGVVGPSDAEQPMVKIKAGVVAAGAVVVAAEWLMISHVLDWVMSGVLAR